MRNEEVVQKEYHWTSHRFYCLECEKPRHASEESLADHQVISPLQPDVTKFVIIGMVHQKDSATLQEIAGGFICCLACAYGPKEWAKECSNPEGEAVPQEKIYE